MSVVPVLCTNPQCHCPLAFDQSTIGSIQQCPHCAQRLIVPDIATTDTQLVPVVSVSPTNSLPAQSLSAPQQERHLEHQTARRLNMGSGCFAMFAVLFVVAILGMGVTTMIGNSAVVYGSLYILAALGGLAAFVFFGYIATETSSRSQGSDRQ